MNAKDSLTNLLAQAGVTINGPEATDVQVHDERVYRRVLSGGMLALGESFMDGWWDVSDLAGLVAKVQSTRVFTPIVLRNAWPLLLKAWLFNLQSRARAFAVGEAHYDLGNDLYERMLDARMVYTAAVWGGVDTLEAAQEQKLELLCTKLGLAPGDRVLDIGCGWGSFMKYAAEQHGVSCVGLSVSKEQIAYGKKDCAELPIEFVLTDYRDFRPEKSFDHIVSVEMIEAVGPKNFATYFKKVHQLLKPGGRFVLQTIGTTDAVPAADPWIDRYIFPNGVLPSLTQLERASRDLFVLEDLENIGPDYDRTLMAWWGRFDDAHAELFAQNPKYNERFYRMWKFYLQVCAGQFRARALQDWQLVYTKR